MHMAKRNQKKPALAVANVPVPTGPRLYTLTVGILQGLIEAKFLKKNPVISRTIQIRGDQTLDDLHNAIFDAFDRFDEHLYQFEVGGRKPMDLNSEKYVHPMAEMPDAWPSTEFAIDALMLEPQQRIFYWFDFGDDWWHWIDVTAVSSTIPPGTYPKVIGRVGKSPPQYLSYDE